MSRVDLTGCPKHTYRTLVTNDETRLVAKLAWQTRQTERAAFRGLRRPHRAGLTRIGRARAGRRGEASGPARLTRVSCDCPALHRESSRSAILALTFLGRSGQVTPCSRRTACAQHVTFCAVRVQIRALRAILAAGTLILRPHARAVLAARARLARRRGILGREISFVAQSARRLVPLRREAPGGACHACVVSSNFDGIFTGIASRALCRPRRFGGQARVTDLSVAQEGAVREHGAVAAVIYTVVCRGHGAAVFEGFAPGATEAICTGRAVCISSSAANLTARRTHGRLMFAARACTAV